MDIQYIDEDDIILEVLVGDEVHTINKVKFFKFIRDNDLHLWVNDYYDASESDRHGQQIGEYTKDEYFKLDFESKIKSDITKFLKEKTK